jgi:hypothetical protein
VGVWVCGCVGVWVCGCVGVWVCGCVGVWVCGCGCVWVCVCVGMNACIQEMEAYQAEAFPYGFVDENQSCEVPQCPHHAQGTDNKHDDTIRSHLLCC